MKLKHLKYFQKHTWMNLSNNDWNTMDSLAMKQLKFLHSVIILLLQIFANIILKIIVKIKIFYKAFIWAVLFSTHPPTFSWIELQMLLQYYLIHTTIIMVNQVIFLYLYINICIFVSMSWSRSIYVDVLRHPPLDPGCSSF